jgi:hypothetical protein
LGPGCSCLGLAVQLGLLSIWCIRLSGSSGPLPPPAAAEPSLQRSPLPSRCGPYPLRA